jgi:hypothetical protein
MSATIKPSYLIKFVACKLISPAASFHRCRRLLLRQVDINLGPTAELAPVL